MSRPTRAALLAAGTLLAAGGAVTLSSGGALAAGAPTPPPSSSPTSSSPTPSSTAPSFAERDCDLSLPSAVRGAPKSFAAGDAAGDYVWHDDSGWHLRVTQPAHVGHVYSGTITATEPIDPHAFRLEASDSYSLSADHKTLTFRFVDHGYLDGLDFHDGCAPRTGFALAADSHTLAPTEVHLGSTGVRPESVPFDIERAPERR